MSETTEVPKIEILPKRETRPTKKRVTIDTKESNNNKSHRQRQEDKRSSGGRNDRRSKGDKNKEPSNTPDDDSENQGFTEWLRSSDGVDTMKLFVIGNSILVVVTVAWPHISQMFSLIRELIYGEDEY
ncbi:uncharacterized protein LOC106639637 [Copidosoma floridanum]|uniref:uncharacterized protein LOC106639637 n=1 Tax=Copidosoma floridanum TaxID=29053 RepID=UPI0006C96B7F|nr:uncharacterized protein LOC106639637 [Copidosoma floridanum]